MNKTVALLIGLALLLTACGSAKERVTDDLIEIEELEKGENSPLVGEYIEATQESILVEKDFSSLKDYKVDEDISILPQTLAFAQVQRMMYDPYVYEGLTVKIQGTYYREEIRELDISLEAVMLMDVTNCCQGYFELEFPEGTTAPNIGTEIMLVGTYTAHNDGIYDYGILVVDKYIF